MTHATFIWSAYGISLVMLLALILHFWLRQRAAMHRLKRFFTGEAGA